jgi:hypothetical protein
MSDKRHRHVICEARGVGGSRMGDGVERQLGLDRVRRRGEQVVGDHHRADVLDRDVGDLPGAVQRDRAVAREVGLDDVVGVGVDVRVVDSRERLLARLERADVVRLVGLLPDRRRTREQAEGEIVHALQAVWGDYRERPAF